MEVHSVAIVVTQKLTIVNNLLTVEKSMIGRKGIVDQLKKIENDLEKLRGFFLDAASAAVYLKILYDVEDAIETFALRISLHRKRLGFLMKHALFLRNFRAYKKFKREIGEIKKEITKLEDPAVRTTTRSQAVRWPVHRSHTINYERMLSSRPGTSYSYTANELGLVGLDEHMKELIEQLTQGNHQIIRVQGEEGSGKTNLARAIHADKRVKDKFLLAQVTVDEGSTPEESSHNLPVQGEMGSGKTNPAPAISADKRVKHEFPPFPWVTIDEDSTPKEILLNLLKQVDSSKDQGCISLEDLIRKLSERLKEQKFLVVLDNLRDTVTWDEIKKAFPDNENGTQIIITTCDEEVAKSANKTYLFNMQKLEDKYALDLFERKAASKCPEDLKTKVLKICNGLPLNVVLLGSLLSTKDPAEWEKKIESQDWQNSDVLALSYNDLSDEEKICLLYMALFPKEYDIPVRRLIRLWLAEGFIITRPSSNDISEDIANTCFNSLVQRSLILITNQRSDGDHRKCRLLGALHKYLFPKAIKIELFHVHRNKNARRLVEIADSKAFTPSSKLRSYLSFNFQKKDIPAREVGVHLSGMLKSGFSLLSVLDLEGVYKPSLPDNLGNFFQLRYLGLRWTFLDHLPSSVGDLTYLETLDLKHTNVNSLPTSVWKLHHLRHLNLNGLRLDIPVTSNTSFPHLLTLCGLSVVDRECRVKDGLDRLHHLRELDLTFELENCKELIDWVSKSTFLEQLRLRSKDDVGGASKLTLKPLSALTKLSHMNLLGELTTPLLLHNEFPQNLKVLTLSVSRMEDDPMETLGQLEHLTVLRLLANSYIGEKIKCCSGGFKELRVLKLWLLPKLKTWELQESCMKKLNELSIRFCPKLEKVPEMLLRQASFKELILNNMPEVFEKAMNEKDQHFSVIVKDFEPIPWELNDDGSEVTHLGSKTTHVNGASTSGSQ